MVSETFMGTALIAEMSDLVLTVPRSVARVVQSPRMTIVAQPLELPVIHVKQYWHERFDHDPGNIWLRSLISECRVDHQLGARRVNVQCKPIVATHEGAGPEPGTTGVAGSVCYTSDYYRE